MNLKNNVFNHLEFGGSDVAAVLKTGGLAFSDNSSDETVEVHRRRRSDGPEGRAEAPQRQEGSSGSGGSSSSGGGSTGGNRNLGGPTRSGQGIGGIPLWLIIVLIVLYFGYNFLTSGNSDQTTDQTIQDTFVPVATRVVSNATSAPVVQQASSTPAPSMTPRPATSGGTGKTWTVMLYQDADDQVLEQDIMTDLNEAEKVGSSDRVKIIAQVDRYKGAYTGDGDWTSARRYFITRDNDLKQVNSKVVADLGEISMSDPKTLVDFVTWSMKNYPADRYALILSDHGMGWPGGFSDNSPKIQKDTSIPLVRAAGDQLYMYEIDNALADIRNQTGLDKFEFFGMDACLMSAMEVYSAIAPHARYAVASEETEPSLGWAYTSFLQSLTSNPDANGAELGQMVVKSYIDDDQRIVDTQARLEFLRQGSSMNSLFGPSDVPAKQLASQLSRSITLTAVDLGAMPTMNDAFNKLSYALQSENQSTIAKARTYAQSYTSVWGDNVPPSYLDVGSFAKTLDQETTKSEVKSAVALVKTALSKLVLAEKHGPDKPGSTGVTIYFPNSTLYQTVAAGPESYNKIAVRFVKQSLWDDFLAFHYSRRPFELNAAEAASPAANTRAVVPGSGSIQISQLKVSSTEAAPGQPVTIQAQLKGTNIGYVYLFVGYVDTKSKSIFVADTDYLASPKTREVDGIYYPQWSDNESFNILFKWNPTVFAISDGKKTVTALFKPMTYGAKDEDAVYTVDGYYTAAGGDTRFARLYFQNMEMRSMYTYTEDRANGAPHETMPQKGDTFTILQTWLEPGTNGQINTVVQKGETLTFGDSTFVWKELYAAVGSYQVGFIVSDLDGNSQESYTPLTVK